SDIIVSRLGFAPLQCLDFAAAVLECLDLVRDLLAEIDEGVHGDAVLAAEGAQREEALLLLLEALAGRTQLPQRRLHLRDRLAHLAGGPLERAHRGLGALAQLLAQALERAERRAERALRATIARELQESRLERLAELLSLLQEGAGFREAPLLAAFG